MGTRQTTVYESSVRIEAEVHTSGVTVQVADLNWPLSSESTDTVDDYVVTMMLSPGYRYAQSRYIFDQSEGAFVNLGKLVLMPAGVKVRSRASGGQTRMVRCCIDPSRFESLAAMGEGWEPHVLNHCLDIREPGLHDTMVRLAQETIALDFGMKSMVEALGQTIAIGLARHIRSIRSASQIVYGGLAPWQLKRITAYVESNPGNACEPAKIADLCGISTGHLRRLFKQTTKQTLHSYIRDQWVNKAKSLLCDTDMPVKVICAEVGFSDPSSFGFAFRRATGYAPRTFRQQFGSIGARFEE
jgi:AraC family transcriptional regulator